jgi:TP901 family phage tail tape measure protein
MSEVAAAYVTLIPSAKGFGAATSRQISGSMQQAGREGGRQYGQGFTSGLPSPTVLLAGLVAGAAASFVKSGITLQAEFGRTMSVLAATTNAPAAKISELEKLAISLGASTTFSASEAAGAMLELAKQGMSPAVIQGGALAGVLTLAAAGGTDLTTAATIAASALNVFKLKGSDVATVAAALAAGANASAASVESLGAGLNVVGPGAVNAGLSVNETVAALTALSKAGTDSTVAGDSLKNFLIRLVPATDKAAAVMKDLGLKFTDAKGEFLPLADIAQLLRDKLSKLSSEQRTSALATIFGNDASAAANALYSQGKTGILALTKATMDKSAAQKAADAQTSGSAGALSQLSGAYETLQLSIGKAIEPLTIFLAGDISAKFGAIGSSVSTFAQQFSASTGVGGKFRDVITSLFDSLSRAGGSIKAVAGDLLFMSGALNDGAGTRFGDAIKTLGTVIAGTARAVAALTGFLADNQSILQILGGIIGTLTIITVGYNTALFISGGGLKAFILSTRLATLATSAFSAVTGTAAFVQNACSKAALGTRIQLGLLAIQQRVVAIATGIWSAATATGAAIQRVANLQTLANVAAMTVLAVRQAAGAVATLAFAAAQKVAGVAARAWAAGQWLVNAAMTANPIGLVVVAIVALIAIIVVAYKKNETFRNIVNAAWQGIKTAVLAVVNWFKTAVPAAWNAVKAKTASVWASISGVVRVTVAIIRAVISTYIRAWQSIISAGLSVIRKVFSVVWSGISAVVRGVVSVVRGYISLLVSGFSLAGRAASAVGSAVRAGFSAAVGAVRSGVGSIVSTVGTIKSRVLGAFSSFGSLLVGAGQRLIQGLIDGVLSKIAAVRTAVGSVAGAVKGFFPGSPVKEGPLTSWNNGGAGKRLISQGLIAGIDAQRSAVRDSMLGVAQSVIAPNQRFSTDVTGAARVAVGPGSGGPLVQINGPVHVRDEDEMARRFIQRGQDAINAFGLASLGLAS